jgi:uncharacterized membrane protein YjdF
LLCSLDHRGNPSVDWQAWVLENLLLIIFAVVLFFGHRRLQLSSTSYFLLATFIALHIIGAHYTYARMPLGLWAKDYFDFSRNHYDRFAHGAFGFLLVYPARELLLRFSGTSRCWSFWLAAAIILAEAMRRVLRGAIVVSEKMTGRLLEKFSGGRKTMDSPLEGLSDRELEVFQLIGQGKP